MQFLYLIKVIAFIEETKMSVSFKVRKYKCFGEEYQGFDTIKKFNVIIGKNNSGKSKLLEALEYFVKNGIQVSYIPDIQIGNTFTKEQLIRVFADNVSSGTLGNVLGNNSYSHWDLVGKYLVGHPYTLSLYGDDKKIDTDLSYFKAHLRAEPIISPMLQKIQIINPFDGYHYLHLQAERDIKKEKINFDKKLSFDFIDKDASHITDLIARMLNDESGNQNHWQEYIENDFLDLINKIVSPEIQFSRIYTKTNSVGTYEIYLEEKGKGGIKLSDCGSGLKTVIATLTLLHIIPFLTQENKFVYALEELENNMHPSLERKLLFHIKDYIMTNKDMLLFLTTHSNVVIDLFGNDNNSQILRVTNDGHYSTVQKVDTWNDKKNLLDELGIKASDILQSNCIIWVEGPSDRIYINKWIQLFNTGSPLQEGLDYQCVFYGGALLAHYSADDNGLINLLKVNKNSYVVMDSDKRSSDGTLKQRVQEIAVAMPDNHWITAGKEIENYLPKEAISAYFGEETEIEQYALFPDLYKERKDVDTFDKVSFASEIIQKDEYNVSNLEKCLDLKEQMKKLIDFIKAANL